MTKGRRAAPAEGGKKRSLWSRLSVVLAVLAVVLAVAALSAMEDGQHFAGLRRWLMYGDTGKARDTYTYSADQANRFAWLGEQLLVATPNSLRLLDADGTVICDEPVNLTTPGLSVGSGQAAVWDIGGGSLYLLDGTGLRERKSTSGGMAYYTARLNSRNWLAVTEQKSGYKDTVSVYNAAGVLVFHFDSHDSYISDAVVTEDCSKLVAVSLGAEGGAFASTLVVYDLATAEKLGEHAVWDGLVMDFCCNGNKVVSLCDTRLVITDLSGQTLLDHSYGGQYLYDYALTGEDFCALLLGRYQAGNVSQLTTFDLEGNQLATLALSEEVLDLSAAGGTLAVLYDNSLVLYDQELRELSRLDNTGYAGRVIAAPHGEVLVISGTAAWRYLP